MSVRWRCLCTDCSSISMRCKDDNRITITMLSTLHTTACNRLFFYWHGLSFTIDEWEKLTTTITWKPTKRKPNIKQNVLWRPSDKEMEELCPRWEQDRSQHYRSHSARGWCWRWREDCFIKSPVLRKATLSTPVSSYLQKLDEWREEWGKCFRLARTCYLISDSWLLAKYILHFSLLRWRLIETK